MARPYTKRRSIWATRVMVKYFPEWREYDEQVPLYDFRGWDPKTIESAGVLIFTRAMPRADVIALRAGELLIVEFDSQMVLTSISRLERYVDAIKNDYVRPEWHTRIIHAAYVTPGYEARFEAECKRRGFRYIVEPEVR